jgi:FkbM family methyltransferase
VLLLRMWPGRSSERFSAPCLALVFSLLVLTWTCEATSPQPKYHRKRAAADAGASALSLKADLSQQHLLSAPASMRDGSRVSGGSNPAFVKLLASKLASPLSYNATLLNTWGFKQAGCGKGDFLVADTGMVDRWICSTEGEQLVTAAMDKILSTGCRSRNGRPSDALFLDVGSNSGFYGLNAIAHGCVAAFFDVQPGCNKVVNAALLVNGFTDRGVVMAAGLSDRDGVVPASSEGTCALESGRFPISAIETNTLNDGDVDVPVLPLSRLLPPSPSSSIVMLKIDTEGLEQRILAGAMPLFEKKIIEHVVVEVTPGHGFWEKRGVVAADVANTMRDIAACGYSFTGLSSRTKATMISDPEQVHALFSTREFTQEDFLLSRTR